MSNPAIAKFAYRLGQMNQMLSELNMRFHRIHDQSTDELQKACIMNGIKEIEEIELMLGTNLLEKLHDFD